MGVGFLDPTLHPCEHRALAGDHGLSGDESVGHGQGTRSGIRVDEIVEHLCEETVLVFGGVCFGDGSDGAEVGVEDDVFD